MLIPHNQKYHHITYNYIYIQIKTEIQLDRSKRPIEKQRMSTPNTPKGIAAKNVSINLPSQKQQRNG